MADGNPGKEPALKPKRIQHTLNFKIECVLEAERRVVAAKELSLKAFCREKDIQPKQLRFWTRDIAKLKMALDQGRAKADKRGIQQGRPSRLVKIQDQLLPWIRVMQQSGATISVRLVAMRARRYDPSLRRLKRYSLFAAVRRFLNSKGIVTRAKTRVSQEDPRQKHADATGFLNSTRPLLAQPKRSQRYILNMDQTPFNPHDSAKHTLADRGARTVSSKEIKTSMGRVSVLLTVCADGHKLPPLIVFKGKHGGTVEKEFKKDYPDGVVCCVQENAWTDERVMLAWVDSVLKPFVDTAPEGVVPYLIMDKYGCHYQGSVAHAIEDLGVEWDIIPGGCTSLIQPVDVGCNKPFKTRLRYKMEDWLIDEIEQNGDRVYDRIKPKIVRKLTAEWAAEAWQRIPEEIIYNSWRHQPMSYFPDEPCRPCEFNDDEEAMGEEEIDNVDAVGI